MFNSDRFTVVFILVLYMLILKGRLLIFPISIDNDDLSIFSDYLFRLIEWVFGDSLLAPTILATLLVLIQALSLNQLVNEYKLLGKRTYLPAMTYVLLTSLFVDFSVLTPVIVANTFLIVVLRKTFVLYQKITAYEEVFDIGLLIGMASLFYFPFLFLILFLVLGLTILRPFNWREWVIGSSGVLVPYLLLGTYFFWIDNLGSFLQLDIVDKIRFTENKIVMDYEILIKGSLLIFTLGWSLIRIQANLAKSSVQVRKFSMVLIWFLVLGSLSVIILPEMVLSHFVVIAIPASSMIAYNFLMSKQRFFVEFLHIVFLGLILYYQYQEFINI